MYRKKGRSWTKHIDFMLLDVLCMQIAFIVSYICRFGLNNPYIDKDYRILAVAFLLMCCLLVFGVWLWTELHILTNLNIFRINALLGVAIILSSFKSLKFEGNFYNCGDDCRLTNRLQKNGRGKKKIYV